MVLPVRVPWFEEKVIENLARFQSFLNDLHISYPIMVFLSLTGVKGYRIYIDGPSMFDDTPVIDRDILFLDGQVITQEDQLPEHILKPIFDLLWNAMGYPKSSYYTNDSSRKPKR